MAIGGQNAIRRACRQRQPFAFDKKEKGPPALGTATVVEVTTQWITNGAARSVRSGQRCSHSLFNLASLRDAGADQYVEAFVKFVAEGGGGGQCLGGFLLEGLLEPSAHTDADSLLRPEIGIDAVGGSPRAHGRN